MIIMAKSKKVDMYSGRYFEVWVQNTKQVGIFTARECGEKLMALLSMMGSTNLKFKEVDKAKYQAWLEWKKAIKDEMTR